MSRVARLIQEALQLEQAIKKAEETLNKMRAKHLMLTTVDLPEAMTEIGSSHFTTDNHIRCEVSYKVYGSLPSREKPEERYAAIEYLKEHDGAHLITSTVEVDFAKGDIRNANKLYRMLNTRVRRGEIDAEVEPIVKVDSNVHHSSLAAWGRARVAENKPVDLARVGLRGLTLASVKLVEPK